MSKGLKLTLVTVAVALMGMSALAEAPVIDEIPSPIVGGGSYTTPPNTFVYPDAINLNAYVSDDGGVENIVWSYEPVGTQIYSINGNDPIDSSTEDPTDPTGKDLNTVRNGEENPDGNALDITIRNEHLSPLGGTNVDPGATTGILSSETQVLTLYASDGSTFSQGEILVYTDNEGQDRISGGEQPVFDYDFTNDNNGFASVEINSATVTVESNGVCIEVAAANVNVGTWTGPYADFQMEGNSVYHIRATMNGTQTTAGLVPLWDIVVQNYDATATAPPFGANAYLTDYLFLDNEGGAYAIGPTSGINSVDLYFVPLPAMLPSWNDSTDGAWTAANDQINDIQIIFRMLDADASGGYGGELDFGQVCVKTLAITRIPLDAIIEGATVLNLAMNDTNYTGDDILGSTDFDWGTAGQVTISPADGNFETELTQLFPGDGDNPASGGTGAITDDFPITWEANTIYMVEMSVSAPSAGDEDQPVDVIQVGMDPPTWENFMLNSVTRGDSTMHNIGMPKSGTPQTYVTLYKSDKVTLSNPTNDFDRLRPRVQVLNASGLVFNGQANNQDAFTIHGITVKKVTM